MRISNSRTDGSVMIWTVLVITILSLVAAELLQVVSSKYQNALHTATWQEALLAAESGIDIGIRELRKSLYPDGQPWHEDNGWTDKPINGGVGHGLSTVTNAGLSNTNMTVEVRVDAPSHLKDPVNSWQYYRIRTIGTMPITGAPRASDNAQDNRLRKMSLKVERFAGTTFAPAEFKHPQVSRRVEAIVRPVSAFDLAIMSVGALDLTDQNIIIDSYDSRDTTKSTGGLYDVAKRQQNGDIATDGTIINAGNAHVYGDVATNSGTVSGVANVTGTQRNDFYQEPIPVAAPVWNQIYTPNPQSVSGNATLAAAPTEGTAASRYLLSAITLSGSGTLRLQGNTDGSPSYIEIYVTGDVKVTGTADLIIDPGVHAKLYFGGNVEIAGNGVVNTNNKPVDLLMYGITPPTGTSKSLHLGGNARLSAAVYAPGHDVQINNGGTRGSAYGSFVGKTVKMNGVTDLHYDEALSSGGAINNYKIVSWFEDTR